MGNCFVRRDLKIPGEFPCGVALADAKQLCGEVDHIAGFLTTEAIVSLVQLETGCVILMEWAPCHSYTVYFQTIELGSFQGSDGCLNGFE